jgi:hypothetical protein
MRAYLALLGLTLAACSSSNETTPAERLNNLGKPALTPLGSTADRDTPAARAASAPVPARASAYEPISTEQATWPAPFVPGATCQLTARQAATIRTRPRADAPQFGQLAAGDKVQLAARTADGWVGFNPGTAQAANVGIFRLRWVRAAEAFDLNESCAKLPVVQAPPLGCLLMAVQAVPVHPHPVAGTSRLSTIPAGSYAQVVRTGMGGEKWTEVRVPGSGMHGYVAPNNLNFSGDCQ